MTVGLDVIVGVASAIGDIGNGLISIDGVCCSTLQAIINKHTKTKLTIIKNFLAFLNIQMS